MGMVFVCGLMALSMKACGSRGGSAVLVVLSSLVAICMRVSGSQIVLRGTANASVLTGTALKVNGPKDSDRAPASKKAEMANIRANFNKVKNTATVPSSGLTVKLMKENGWRMRCTGQEFLLVLMERYIKDSFRGGRGMANFQ